MKGENANKYVALNIENGASENATSDIVNDTADLNYSNNANAAGIDAHKSSIRRKSPPAAHILKTLFFVLVWYFFSLLLTL